MKCCWNGECAQAVKSKRRAYSLYCKHEENIQNLTDFKKTQAKARQIILTSRKNSYINFVSSITSQTTSTTIWRKIQAIQHKWTRRTIVLEEGGKITSQPEQVASMLVREYSNRSNGLSSDKTFENHRKNEEKMKMFLLTEP